MIRIGPAGVYLPSAKSWDYGGRVGVAQIFISHGDRIDSIQFQFVENGTLVLSDKHGRNAGTTAPKFSAVRIRYPSEFVTGISGYYSPERIVSLAFITNKGTYGPFGGCAGNNDTAFEYKLGEDNTFGGFHGTAGAHLNSIGIYMKPMTTLSNVDIPKDLGESVIGVLERRRGVIAEQEWKIKYNCYKQSQQTDTGFSQL